MEAAAADTGQDVDPDAGDFQVALACFCRALFLNPWTYFSYFFVEKSFFSVDFGSRFWVPKMDPKMGLRIGF